MPEFKALDESKVFIRERSIFRIKPANDGDSSQGTIIDYVGGMQKTKMAISEVLSLFQSQDDFVQFSRTDNSDVWINRNSVSFIRPSLPHNQPETEFFVGGQRQIVKDDYEVVIQKLGLVD